MDKLQKTTGVITGKGRPTLYKPEYCERVIELGRQGQSLHQMSADLDVSFVTLTAWRDKYPEFQAAITRARELSQAWWEDLGQKGCTDRDFNAQAYRLQMINRFPDSWRDKTDLAHSGLLNTNTPVERMSADDVRAELQRRGALDEHGKLIQQK
ncbi:MAG: hypothetical protein ABSC01_06795 [Verrucomicrobiota bacterium]|jgi:transposase